MKATAETGFESDTGCFSVMCKLRLNIQAKVKVKQSHYRP
jgi:hypothetical protein